MRQVRKKAAKQRVSITLDTYVIKAIKGLAAENERSFSQSINFILKRHITSYTIEQPAISKLPADK
ncbi:MAG: toxin-antitoxin system protein [Clostridiales bacterium]|nr:toxin-antitoxin system protein [Clostridiales bacterium]